MAGRTAASILFLFTAIVQHATSEYCSNASSISANLETLLAEYPNEQPPSTPIYVSVDLDVKHATLNENSGRMRLLADLDLVWQDSRLEWNTSDWGCNTALVSAERLWRPDLTLLNAGASNGATTDDLPASISADGTVKYISRLDVTVPVTINLKDWPNDVQKAKFLIGSRSFSAKELVIDFNTRKFVTVSESGGWEIISVSNALSEINTADDQRYIATSTVYLRRRAPAHSMATSAVFATTVIELMAAAMLPLEERTPLYACAAFTGTLWLISALLRMPHAASAPLSLSLMSAICVLSAVACIFVAMVQRVARLQLAPPGVIRRLLTAASGLCKLTPDESASSQASESGAWLAAAKLLDNLLISAQLVALLIIISIYMFS